MLREDNMKKDTKELIYETFIALLGQKPFDRITIKDIVETCNINRNTFYYYYSDIYDLLEEVFVKELDVLVQAHKKGSSWVLAFIKVAGTAYTHKKIVNNICSSRSYDYLENYMYKACKHIMIDAVQFEAKGMDIPADDIDFIASFYEYAMVGVISEWFRTGMREEPMILAKHLGIVLDGIKLSLRKSQKISKRASKDEDSL